MSSKGIVTVSYKTHRDTYRNTYQISQNVCGKSVSLHPYATGRWFSPVSSINKTDCHDITEILLKIISFLHFALIMLIVLSPTKVHAGIIIECMTKW